MSDLCWFFSQEESWIRKQIAMAGLPPGYKIRGAKNRWWETGEIRAWSDATRVPAGTRSTPDPSVHPLPSRKLGLPKRA